MQRRRRRWIFNLIAPILPIFLAWSAFGGGPRVIELTATKDNRFKVAGQKDPVITLKAGEVVKLRITTFKGPEYEKDGTAHTLTIMELKDQGWNLRLKEGTEDFTVVAPSKPGVYETRCYVKCGHGHADMQLQVVVTA